jgi:hypothetical protein
LAPINSLTSVCFSNLASTRHVTWEFCFLQFVFFVLGNSDNRSITNLMNFALFLWLRLYRVLEIRLLVLFQKVEFTIFSFHLVFQFGTSLNEIWNEMGYHPFRFDVNALSDSHSFTTLYYLIILNLRSFSKLIASQLNTF